MSDRLVLVKDREEFKHLANELKLNSIVYNIGQTVFFSKTREFTRLHLIISSKKYYVYVDFRKGDALRETRIPINVDQAAKPWRHNIYAVWDFKNRPDDFKFIFYR